MLLNEFQEEFKDLMLDDPKTLDHPPEKLAAFCEIGEIALPDRLKVYRNNIVGSLTDVMVATFPILDRLVGREFLELMARSYILENPPEHGCLSLYGEGFDGFIEAFELAKSLPYLPDVARFELALNKAYYAQDDTALKADALAAIAPDDLPNISLKPRHSVQLLRSRFPLTAIREFCMADKQDGQLNLDQGGEALMVYRPELETQTVILSEDEFMMLEQLQTSSLGEAAEKTLKHFPDFDFQAFLEKHITLETFRAHEQNI